MSCETGFAQKTVLGIAEILWHLLPDGKQLGGAPGNFAYHARALGADGRIISRIGDDDLGKEVINRLVELDVPSDGICVDPHHPTGTVSVELSADGQPQYEIHRDVAWDHLELTANGRRIVGQAGAICFGTLALAQRKYKLEPPVFSKYSILKS